MTHITAAMIGAGVGLVIGPMILAIITLIFRWLVTATMSEVFGVK